MARTIIPLVSAFYFLRCAVASPAAQPAAVLEAEKALITPSPTLAIYADATKTQLQRRGIFSDITQAAESDIHSVLSDLGNVPSYVASGILPGFQGYPTGSAVLSSANVSNTDLSATPTKVLNIPGYANWTDQGWSLRVHGNVYKYPDISNDTINKLANQFVIGSTSVQDLPPSQSAQAVNLTREIYVVQQGNVNVTVNIEPAQSAGGSGQPGGGGGTNPPGGSQMFQLPNPTTPEGDFDTFVPLQNTSGGLLPGNTTAMPQKINVYASRTDEGNATSYLISTQGTTIVNDIDDILRVTKIYEPSAGLNNTFVYPFTPWLNMPEIFANWSTSLPEYHFHYLTTTPEQITRNYMQYIYSTYPGGSFDTRPLNFSDISATLSIRKFLLDKIFQTFPQRKFILIADTSNSDVMKDYPAMYHQYPGQVQCIFLRNTSATDPKDKFPYNTSGFKGIPQNFYMFFLVPDDLKNLDIEHSQCWNQSVPQNVTFGYQGLPGGFSTGSGNSSSSTSGAGRRSANSWAGSWMGSSVVVGVAFYALL